jgi:hypothetical protein
MRKGTSYLFRVGIVGEGMSYMVKIWWTRGEAWPRGQDSARLSAVWQSRVRISAPRKKKHHKKEIKISCNSVVGISDCKPAVPDTNSAISPVSVWDGIHYTLSSEGRQRRIHT